MDYTLVFAIVFVSGTLLLSRSGYDRYLKIVFMIRTKHFIRVIDSISGISPRLWTLLTDISLTLFFGGVGFAYLSKNRISTNSLSQVFAVIGLIAILSISPNISSLLLLLASLALGVYSLRERSLIVEYLTGSVLVTAIALKTPTVVLGLFGFPVEVPWWLALIEGFFGILPILLILFLAQAYDIVFQGSQQPGVAPAVPDVRGGELGLSFPGTTIFIPIVYALIAFITALVCHEFAHGIIARVYELELKSTGLLTLGIMPIGAFVEPDEKKLRKRPSIQKMRIFIAGSFANLVVSLIAGMLFLTVYSNPAFIYTLAPPEGMQVVDFGANSTVEDIIGAGEIIRSIDDKPVKNTNQFREVTSQLKPGVNATLVTDKGRYNIKLGENPENKSRAYIGIVVAPYNGVLDFITKALFWIWFINFNLSLVNLLPVVPFDGWRILEELAKTFQVNQKEAMNIVKGVVAFSMLLLLLNALPLLTQAIDLFMDLLSRI